MRYGLCKLCVRLIYQTCPFVTVTPPDECAAYSPFAGDTAHDIHHVLTRTEVEAFAASPDPVVAHMAASWLELADIVRDGEKVLRELLEESASYTEVAAWEFLASIEAHPALEVDHE